MSCGFDKRRVMLCLVAPRVSLRRLEVFCLVVEEGGVTRAAERLFVAQPAVSSQLRGLEEWLGAKLFVRQGTTLELTEAGHRAYEWATEVLARSLEVRRDIDGLAAGSAGNVVITSSMAVGSYLIPAVMTRLRAERPGAEITLHIAEPRPALHQVEIGEADLAVLSWGEQAVPAQIVAEHLHDEPLVLCASPDGEPAADSIPVADVAALPHVGVPGRIPFQQAVTAQLRALGIPEFDPVIRLGHAEPMKQAVVDHGWVCILPRYCVEADLRSGRLRDVRMEGAQLVESVSLFHRKEKRFSPLQQAVLEAVRACPRSD